MPDVRELGRRVKLKYPEYNDMSDEELGLRVRAKYPEYSDFTDATPAMATPPPENTLYQSIKGGLAQAGGTLAGAGNTLYQAGKAALSGDFGPAGNVVESAARGGLGIQAALLGGPGLYRPVAQSQAPAIAKLQAERNAAQAQTPAGRYIQQRNAQLAAEEAHDKTLLNKIARRVARFGGEVAPAVATGVLTGGSVPAIAATTALQQAGQPENIVPSAVLASLPLPVGQAFKSGVNAVRRTFGKGAAQIIEAEALPEVAAQARQAAPEVAPTVAKEVPPIAGNASPEVQRAMQQFEAEVQRINASNMTPRQKAIDLEIAIQRIGQEASGRPPGPGISAVSLTAKRGYPAGEMQFPENPNPWQVAGIMPGEGGPPILEAETGAPQFGVKAAPEPAYRETTGPSVTAAMEMNAPGAAAAPSSAPAADINAPWEAKWENQPLQQALIEGSRGLPTPLATRIKDELLGAIGGVPKQLRSSIDISAAGRQGSILSYRPFQWRQFTKAWVNQFKAFKTKNFEAINEAIASHPDAGLMEESGLYLSNRAKEGLSKGEEAFFRRTGSVISEKVGKLPGVKQSEQAYTTFLDTQRVEAFQQYKNAIENAALPPEQAKIAYEAAARFINYATGRGSLGQTLNRTMDGLNLFFFSPRYVASRLNILNPGMYIKNALTPGGRVVLRQQMGDLAQYLTMVSTTLYLAHLAGADVTLNPRSPDFGKIKLGSWRWDIGAGLSQTIRMAYGVGEDFKRALFKEKPVKESAIDIGKRFLEYKLSPPAGVVRDFFARKTIDKKPFTYGGAVEDLTVPMQIADFIDAYLKEGFGGIGKTSFGEVGIGVQNYQQTPIEAAIERSKPLFSELQRLNKSVSELKKRGEGDKMEPDDIFNKRVQQFGQNYTLYGLKLLENPRFQTASDDVKGKALDVLNNRAKALTVREFAFPELELDANTILDSVQSAEERKQERVRQRGF